MPNQNPDNPFGDNAGTMEMFKQFFMPGYAQQLANKRLQPTLQIPQALSTPVSGGATQFSPAIMERINAAQAQQAAAPPTGAQLVPPAQEASPPLGIKPIAPPFPPQVGPQFAPPPGMQGKLQEVQNLLAQLGPSMQANRGLAGGKGGMGIGNLGLNLSGSALTGGSV